ncbi:MAG TPA: hypothetical protein VNJ08_08405 [Bacteriovoracaceae bacterium]|nr:hypothetical protein [Bacteriovoracaceae bacterium]
MKYLLLLSALIITSTVEANLHLAPPDFQTDNGHAIFVDFKTAHYDITYDLKKRVTRVKTRITFNAERSGTPVFDLIPEPKNILLNGTPVSQRSISFPGGLSTVRQLDQDVSPGEHVLEMENTFKKHTQYIPLLRYVASAFWIRDLQDRKFLEQYIPSNFEYDQYKMTMDVKFIGNRHAQEIYTNGALTKINKDHYQIEYPEYFTSSCLYFHTTPKGWMKRLDFSYKSISGREIPMTVYSPWKLRTKKFKTKVLKVIAELENDYGPWAHPGLLAYGTFPGTGGMEHAGATATSLAALDHEMLHSYFAKGVMPANGNSGWIDEAIAAWRDRGYPRSADPGFSGSNLGAHSVYQRHTDDRAYVLGSAFMSYIDYRLQDMGGLKAFLKGYFQAYKHTVVTTEHFKNNLEFFARIDLSADFEKYIWGKNPQDVEEILKENPVHGKLTETQLNSLL